MKQDAFSAVSGLTVIPDLIGDLIKNCEKNRAKPPLLVLLGPTASGKTALSLEIAKKWNSEIISADSRQVYKHMNIGTDKIPLEKRKGIPHHLIDVASPDERFTVVDFMRMAERRIKEIQKRGRLPLLVGGTGLYINALTENFKIPETGGNLRLRRKLESEMKKRGIEWLHEKLKAVDPETAQKIPPQSYLYVLRALEIFYLTGKPKKDRKGKPKYATLKIGLKWPKETLAERIAERVESQFKRGLVDEVKKLLAMGYSKKLPALRSIGYCETIAHLEGRLSLGEAKNLIIKNTKQFARRQMTWFKRNKEIVWIEGEIRLPSKGEGG